MSAVPSDELYSLIVPVADAQLVLPRTCVAEVVSWRQPDVVPNTPQWFLGNIEWNDRLVPVVSFESMCSKSIASTGARSRIIICVGLTGKLDRGYFGMVTQGFPQLVRLSPDLVKSDPKQPAWGQQPVLCQVRMINDAPLIPDFEKIERMIVEAMAH
ncbi:MAG TPA: chemotaxis protein CheW [Steroidobacteraceae bacterium]|nr:chemotaxis protein CheW [Steroidobacteraceae bacterium]